MSRKFASFCAKFTLKLGWTEQETRSLLAESRFYHFALCIPGFSPVASALRRKLFEPFCSLKINEWVSGHSVWDSVPTRWELSIGVWQEKSCLPGFPFILGSFYLKWDHFRPILWKLKFITSHILGLNFFSHLLFRVSCRSTEFFLEANNSGNLECDK